jgi:hypothetical protein
MIRGTLPREDLRTSKGRFPIAIDFGMLEICNIGLSSLKKKVALRDYSSRLLHTMCEGS